VARRNVNGLPAVLAEFAAQTEQGTVQGLVGFISYGEATYQVVGYTSAQGYADVQRALLDTIESFGPLTDKAALNVQPHRIDIVTLPRAMTVREFARAYPSKVDEQTLALLNEVADADAQLPAGKRVKRVVEQ
jgi:predicted Zn-dependent protease